VYGGCIEGVVVPYGNQLTNRKPTYARIERAKKGTVSDEARRGPGMF